MEYFLVDEAKTTAPTASQVNAIVSPVYNVVELWRQLLQFIEKFLVFFIVDYKDFPIPLETIEGLLPKIVRTLIGADVITEVIWEQFFDHLVAPVFLHADFDFLK